MIFDFLCEMSRLYFILTSALSVYCNVFSHTCFMCFTI